MSINNVRAVGDDRAWKDEVERELKSLLDIIKYGKITLRSSVAPSGGGAGGGADSITATLPATYNNTTYVVGVDQDAFDRIANLDYAQFDTTVSTGTYNDVGLLTWNDTDGTLEFGLKGGNVTLQIGQEQVVRVRNNTGSTLNEGTVCYFNGSNGTNFNVTPALANADATSAQTMGVLTETLNTSSTQHGFLTTFGLVRNIDISYISGLTDGDQLYLDPTTAGRMTRTKPSAPDHLVYVGICLSAAGSGSNSTIFVKVQNGYELDEIHDVKITGPVANNELLARTSATGLWENKTATEAGLVETTDSRLTDARTPTGSAGGDLTGTYPNPTIKASVELTNPKILRDNTGSEGGQLNFARASDNATYWYIDSYGSTSTPDLRFVSGTNNFFQFNSNGSLSLNGQTGTSGQVLQSTGASTPPQWATVSGTSSNSFTTMNAPAGTDPIATSSTDTLNFANGTGISITGDSATKTLTVAATEAALIPAGAVQMYAGSGTPTGWLLCDGTAVSRTTYAALFTAIGTTYGAGNGSTTFNLPNMTSKFPRGGTTPSTGGGSDTHTHTLTPGTAFAQLERANNQVQFREYSITPSWNATSSVTGTGQADTSTGITTGVGVDGDTDSATAVPAYVQFRFIIKT